MPSNRINQVVLFTLSLQALCTQRMHFFGLCEFATKQSRSCLSHGQPAGLLLKLDAAERYRFKFRMAYITRLHRFHKSTLSHQRAPHGSSCSQGQSRTSDPLGPDRTIGSNSPLSFLIPSIASSQGSTPSSMKRTEPSQKPN